MQKSLGSIVPFSPFPSLPQLILSVKAKKREIVVFVYYEPLNVRRKCDRCNHYCINWNWLVIDLLGVGILIRTRSDSRKKLGNEIENKKQTGSWTVLGFWMEQWVPCSGAEFVPFCNFLQVVRFNPMSQWPNGWKQKSTNLIVMLFS